MTLASGSRLGPYEIVGQIGAGGMGEVYRAKDPRLGRDVAIKVLPASFSADADRLRRFEQEAKAAGVLNHPNITAVHDIGSHDDAPYVVQELLEGDTLRSVLAGGKLSPRRAVDYGVQIARGLAAAHEKGIVHRDLKPENVFVTKDGRLKILDFGLAKLTQVDAPDSPTTNLPTESRGTEPGVVLGTIGYMSPEQVRGRPADARSDIFAFGAILYEMLSGNRAFRGDSAADTMSAILREDPPDLSVTNQSISPGLERIVRHCLEKNPEQRFHSASDIAFDLEALSGTSGTRSAPGIERPTRRALRWALGGLAGLLLVAGAYRVGTGRRHAASGSAPLRARFAPLTSSSGLYGEVALAPDGKLVAYVARVSGNEDIYVLRVGGTNPIDLTKDEPADDYEPSFSPDGSQIAFRSERQSGGIFLVGATGESIRRLTDSGYAPAWSPDGKEIVFATEGVRDPLDRAGISQLWSVDVASGRKQRLFDGDAVQPSISPHGLRIAYWGLPVGSRRQVFTIPRAGLKAGEKPVPVTDGAAVDWNPVWSPDGRYLYFGSNRGGTLNLWRVAIDEASGRTLSAPEPVTTPSRWSGFFSISGDGLHIAYLSQHPMSSVERVAFDPVAGRIVGAPTTIVRGSLLMTEPDISPDGEWIVLRSHGVQDHLYVVKPDGTALRQITADAHRDRDPKWSPDGKRIAFHSDRSGPYQAWTILPDGSGLTQLTDSRKHEVLGIRWSPDGTKISWEDGDHAGIYDLSQPKGGEGDLLPMVSERQAFFPGAWSRDGKFLVGNTLGAGIWTYSLDSHRYERLTEGGRWPIVLKDVDRVLFEDQGRLFLYDPARKASTPVSDDPSGPPVGAYAASHDNRWLCLVRNITEGDVWMATLETEPQAGAPR
jgi:Tol biopolymer transport system component